MNNILMSLGDKPAAEGIGGVISSALLAAGTLALIYLVLVLIDKYHKKHSTDEQDKPASPPESTEESFRKVLTDEIKKKDEENGSRHI